MQFQHLNISKDGLIKNYIQFQRERERDVFHHINLYILTSLMLPYNAQAWQLHLIIG